MEQLVTIELLGQLYTFKTEAELSKAKEVADLLAEEVSRVETQLEGKSPPITKQTILVLAALNIASENSKLKKEHSDLANDISKRSANLIGRLDKLF